MVRARYYFISHDKSIFYFGLARIAQCYLHIKIILYIQTRIIQQLYRYINNNYLILITLE